MKLGSYTTCTDCAALVRRYRRGQPSAFRCRLGYPLHNLAPVALCPKPLSECEVVLARKLYRSSHAAICSNGFRRGRHAIKDMEQGDTVCLFMLKRGGSFEQLRDNLNTCLRALNYVDEQRKEKKHGLASDSPR